MNTSETNLATKLFQSVVNDSFNKLHDCLPTRCNAVYNLRRERRFAEPVFRKKRFADSFVNGVFRRKCKVKCVSTRQAYEFVNGHVRRLIKVF